MAEDEEVEKDREARYAVVVAGKAAGGGAVTGAVTRPKVWANGNWTAEEGEC